MRNPRDLSGAALRFTRGTEPGAVNSALRKPLSLSEPVCACLISCNGALQYPPGDPTL